ncbi:MAG TPA: hypothetical protein VIV60_05985 [Polyangiaceae bacterium]
MGERWAYTTPLSKEFTTDLGRLGRDMILKDCIALAHMNANDQGVKLREQPDAIVWRPGRYVVDIDVEGREFAQFEPCRFEVATHEELILHFDIIPSEDVMVDVVTDL